ncbi:MAG: M48 family metalloprotease [Synechococcaceae cyanobacterium]|nr:M48 family metalloprotease [Synechococcaceae cyanobacterium]
MPFSTRQRRLFGLGATALVAAAAIAGGGAWVWMRRMPAEYRTMESVVRRLASGNTFGSQPINFSVTSGSFTAQLAEGRGLCKPESCDLFAHLNPYRTYANGWDELIRQGYALGDIEAWSASSGTVVVPRPSFRVYGPRIGWLSCTVAHEIAHVQRHHIFQQSYYASHAIKGLSQKDKGLRSMAKSREQELEADRDAADMLARAGYKGRVCVDEMIFMYKSTGDGSETEDDATHPGFDERLAALKKHYDRREKELAAAKAKGKMAEFLIRQPTSGSFHYSPGDNLLTFVPQAQ